MKATYNEFQGIIFIEPSIFGDSRGFFLESWSIEKYAKLGIKETFKQDNLSYSKKNCLRGLHFQINNPQGQLVWVSQGEIFDVCVDIRPSSKTFGQWFSKILSSNQMNQVYMPPGFAHGFYVLSDEAYVNYKCTEVYKGNNEGGIFWQDDMLNIDWPCEDPIISERDMSFSKFKEHTFDGQPKIEY